VEYADPLVIAIIRRGGKWKKGDNPYAIMIPEQIAQDIVRFFNEGNYDFLTV